MGSGHSHAPSATLAEEKVTAPAVRRAMLAVVALLSTAIGIGLVALWPGDDIPEGTDNQSGGVVVEATVRRVTPMPCAGSETTLVEGDDALPPGFLCDGLVLEVTSGPTEGTEATVANITVGALPRGMEPGVGVLLGYQADAPEGFQYYFVDFQRSGPLWWLAALFALAVIGLGRLKGLRALIGLGLSLVVLVVFVLPALLAGSPPLAVALVGGGAIALSALYLAHGFNDRTTVAVIATFASLGLTGVLASVFVGLSRFTGLATEEATFLQVSAGTVDLQGLLLAGILIGSLGVLDDVTVTQVSAVTELRMANPSWGPGRLYRSGLRIGRDHIASTVNTLVLAYAGASLPLLLLFTQAGRPVAEVITGEIVATEVVRTLVGSIGLVAAVPLATILAALVVTRDTARIDPPVRSPQEPPRQGDPASWDDFAPEPDGW